MGFPGIVVDEHGEVVEGFLFTSDQLDEHWERLDEFEGEAYERLMATVTRTDGSTVQAYLYAIKAP